MFLATANLHSICALLTERYTYPCVMNSISAKMFHSFQAGEQQALKNCPICRQPLAQIMRYGRPLNHMKVQHADIKFFLHCNQELAEADKMYAAASKAASDSANRAGTLFPPVSLTAVWQRSAGWLASICAFAG